MPKFNVDYFAKICTEPQAYWWGFLMADGCVYRNGKYNEIILALKTTDLEHLEKFVSAIGSAKKIYHKQKLGLYESRHSSSKMCDDLSTLGCLPRKSLILKFPNVDRKLLPHFVRGYFDGDGSAYLQAGKVCCNFTGTQDFLFVLEKQLRSFGLRERPVETSGSGNCYKLRYQDRQSVRDLASWMYKDCTVCLGRKRDYMLAA